jgi:hypothetical protein
MSVSGVWVLVVLVLQAGVRDEVDDSKLGLPKSYKDLGME